MLISKVLKSFKLERSHDVIQLILLNNPENQMIA